MVTLYIQMFPLVRLVGVSFVDEPTTGLDPSSQQQVAMGCNSYSGQCNELKNIFKFKNDPLKLFGYYDHELPTPM